MMIAQAPDTSRLLGPLSETGVERWLDTLIVHLHRPGAVPVALGLACVVGAVHALGPGHGKSVVAAYFSATSGRAVHAVAIGGAVALMHSGSSVALGGALIGLGHGIDFEEGQRALWVISGVLMVVTGILLVRRTRHIHSGHPHEAKPTEVLPTRSGLIAIATAGGLAPSPGAVVTLAAAWAAGRQGLGLGLIGAFGLGVATTVTAAGLLTVRLRRAFVGNFDSHRGARLLGHVRSVGSWLIVAAGLVLLLRAAL